MATVHLPNFISYEYKNVLLFFPSLLKQNIGTIATITNKSTLKSYSREINHSRV